MAYVIIINFFLFRFTSFNVYGKISPASAILIALLGKNLSLGISFLKPCTKSQYITYKISLLDALHLLVLAFKEKILNESLSTQLSSTQ